MTLGDDILQLTSRRGKNRIIVLISVIYVLFFWDDGVLFLGSEEIAQTAGSNGRNGDDKERIGEEMNSHGLGDTEVGTVEVASHHMRDAVEVDRPLGRGELSVRIYRGAVDTQISDGGAYGEEVVGNICAETQPYSVEGAGLKSFSLYSDLISCSDIPYVCIYYEEIEDDGKCADSRYYNRILRILGNGVQEQSEYRQGELIYEKLGDGRGVILQKFKHGRPFNLGNRRSFLPSVILFYLLKVNIASTGAKVYSLYIKKTNKSGILFIG